MRDVLVAMLGQAGALLCALAIVFIIGLMVSP